MLIIMEMANNHQGDLDRGLKIIDEFYKITSKFPQFSFAFKFQRRDLSHIIHPNFINCETGYIKRFKDTQLSEQSLYDLINYAKSLGYITACTPFDEPSVDVIKNSVDYIKIGSCSVMDWPLLNKIAQTDKPIIASVGGGLELEEIQRVVTFFDNRSIPLTLMYCVGLYPTQSDELSLNIIDLLKQNFPNIPIGFSSHELPDNYDAVKLAIAKGVVALEKHVDIEHINAYSIIPAEFEKYLEAADLATKMCKPIYSAPREQDKLRDFKRGAYLVKDVKAGEIITRDSLFFAMPLVDKYHLTAFNCSKYTSFEATINMLRLDPLISLSVKIIDNEWIINDIKKGVKKLLDDNYIVYPPKTQMEISHHYGLDKFKTYGMCIITLINAKYCKKLLVLLPGQNNPAHYHNKKRETFFILCGTVQITIDGVVNILNKGDLITLEPKQVHSIASDTGAVIEELSSRHIGTDSFYIDENITKNLNRKTLVYV